MNADAVDSRDVEVGQIVVGDETASAEDDSGLDIQLSAAADCVKEVEGLRGSGG